MAPAGPAPTTIALDILDFAGSLVVDQRCQAVAVWRRFELADDRPRDRNLLRGKTARGCDDFRLAQQVERAVEHRAVHHPPFLEPRSQFGATLDAHHYRQRTNAHAYIR